jgi:hypothetical protein
MYADDLAIVAPNAVYLQLMLDALYRYSVRRRFEINQGKTQVMITGPNGDPSSQQPPQPIFTCGPAHLQIVKVYKYLGIDFTGTTQQSATLTHTRMLKKARSNMHKSFAMGISGAGAYLTVRAGIQLWRALVRSICEYGSEVYGDCQWSEAEQLQDQMARRILRVSRLTTGAAVRGELGWWTMKARRDMLRLRYWGKLVTMSPNRHTHFIYQFSRQQYLQHGAVNWCSATHDIMAEYGLEEHWINNTIPMPVIAVPVSDSSNVNTTDAATLTVVLPSLPEPSLHAASSSSAMSSPSRLGAWNKVIDSAIQQREQQRWQQECASKPKLRTYITIKKVLEMEQYLIDEDVHTSTVQRLGRIQLTRLRCATNVLRIERGRWERPFLPSSERVCQCCHNGEVEDVRLTSCFTVATSHHIDWNCIPSVHTRCPSQTCPCSSTTSRSLNCCPLTVNHHHPIVVDVMSNSICISL